MKWGGEGEALKYFRAALVEAVEVGVKTWGVGVGLEISGLSWDIESFSISRESPFASAGHREIAFKGPQWLQTGIAAPNLH